MTKAAAVLAAVWLTIGACGAGQADGPVETAQTYLDHITGLDLAAAWELVEPGAVDQEVWQDCVIGLLEAGIDVVLVDARTTIDGDVATVWAITEVTAGGETVTVPERKIGDYRQVDGRWVLTADSHPDSCRQPAG